jgi:hypothetical protein
MMLQRRGLQRREPIKRQLGVSGDVLDVLVAEVGRKPWTPGKPSIANIHCDGLTLLRVAGVFVATGSPLALKFNVKKLVGASVV